MIEHNPTWDIVDSSKLNDFIKCRRKAMYLHIFGWKTENLSNHLAFGRAYHLPMEHFLLDGYNDDSVIAGHQMLLEDYRKDFMPETDELFGAKTPDNALFVLAKYCEKYQNDLDLYDVLYTEIAGSVSIGNDKKIHFRMDSVLKDKITDKIISLEHKTGSGLWMWAEQWALSVQVGTYTHALNCLYSPDEVDQVIMNSSHFLRAKGAWEDLNQQGFTTKKQPFDFLRHPEPRSNTQMQTWLEMITYYYDEYYRELDLLMTKCSPDDPTLVAYPMNPESCLKYGRICEFHDFCTAWPNPLKRYSKTPPIGFKEEFWNPMEQEAKHIMEL